jgi:pyruvate,orthophosphate dikinase
MPAILASGQLLALRSSPEERAWGGPSALLYIGLCDRTAALLGQRIGPAPALELYRRYIPGFSHAVYGLDPEAFDPLLRVRATEAPAIREQIDAMLALFAAEMDEPWPQDAADQLEAAARAMARGWNAASTRILRQAKGAPEGAGLGLVVQRLALGIGPGISGAGIECDDGPDRSADDLLWFHCSAAYRGSRRGQTETSINLRLIKLLDFLA